LLDGLALHGHLVHGHVDAVLVDLAVEPPRDEPVAVRVDQIPRHVLAKRDAGRPREDELPGAGVPERDLGHAQHGAHFQSIAGQKPFGGKDAVRIGLVVTLRLTANSRASALEPFDQLVTSSVDALVLRLERALLLPESVEPLYLRKRPPESALEPRDEPRELIRESEDVIPQDLGRRRGLVRLRPSLAEGALYVGGQIIDVLLDERPEWPQVERVGPHD